MVNTANDWRYLGKVGGEDMREQIPPEITSFSFRSCRDFLLEASESSQLVKPGSTEPISKPQFKIEDTRITIMFQFSVESELLLFFCRPAGDLYFAKCSCKTGKGGRFLCLHVTEAFKQLCQLTNSAYEPFCAYLSEKYSINQAPRSRRKSQSVHVASCRNDVVELEHVDSEESESESDSKRRRLHNPARPTPVGSATIQAGSSYLTKRPSFGMQPLLASPSPSVKGKSYIHVDTPRPLMRVSEPLATPSPLSVDTGSKASGSTKWIPLTVALDINDRNKVRTNLVTFDVSKYELYIRDASSDAHWTAQIQGGTKLVPLGELMIKTDHVRIMIKSNLHLAKTRNKRPQHGLSVLLMMLRETGVVYFAKCSCGGTLASQHSKDHCVHVHQVLIDLVALSGGGQTEAMSDRAGDEMATPNHIAAAVRRLSDPNDITAALRRHAEPGIKKRETIFSCAIL